jgi:hypothetical protein
VPCREARGARVAGLPRVLGERVGLDESRGDREPRPSQEEVAEVAAGVALDVLTGGVEVTEVDRDVNAVGVVREVTPYVALVALGGVTARSMIDRQSRRLLTPEIPVEHRDRAGSLRSVPADEPDEARVGGLADGALRLTTRRAPEPLGFWLDLGRSFARSVVRACSRRACGAPWGAACTCRLGPKKLLPTDQRLQFHP